MKKHLSALALIAPMMTASAAFAGEPTQNDDPRVLAPSTYALPHDPFGDLDALRVPATHDRNPAEVRQRQPAATQVRPPIGPSSLSSAPSSVSASARLPTSARAYARWSPALKMISRSGALSGRVHLSCKATHR